MAPEQLLADGTATANITDHERPVGSRLSALLHKQRTVPDWAYVYPELFDPIRLMEKILVVGIVVSMLQLPILIALGMAGGGYQAVGLAFGIVLLLGAYALAAPRRRTNAFYLRAFRIDSDPQLFRRTLEIGLGTEFRLSGIRSPRRRLPDFVKGLLGTFAMIRYAGARYMELEAGPGWMGRLVASYTYARVAFVDLRELTDHVRQEVVLTLLCLGPARTVFIIDQSQSVEEWTRLVHTIRPFPAGMPPWFLDADDDVATIVSQVRNVVRRLPEGTAGFSEAGWSYVEKHVAASDLVAESATRPGRWLLGGVLVTSVVGAVLQSLVTASAWMVVWGVVLLFSIIYGRAIGGALLSAWRARSLNPDFARSQLERVLAGTFAIVALLWIMV
jgi:hypothetical protein